MLRRFGKSWFEVQCHLAKEGAADLVVELVMKSDKCPNIFQEAVALGNALLRGGNSEIQEMIYKKLQQGSNSQEFFKVRNFN